MDNKKKEMLAMLTKLADDFQAQIPERITKITNAWNDVNDDYNTEKQTNLLRLAHSLAGTSATFGFTDISTAAKALEVILQDINSLDVLKEKHHIICEHIDQLTIASQTN